MADEPVDLAIAAEATPEFRQVDMKGRYVFSVFERFALRIKDANGYRAPDVPAIGARLRLSS